jgi:hypothetical protein
MSDWANPVVIELTALIAGLLAALIFSGGTSTGFPVMLGGAAALAVEGGWQAIAYLKYTAFQDHTLTLLFGRPPATGMVGVDQIAAGLFALPIAWVWGTMVAVGLVTAAMEKALYERKARQGPPVFWP